MFKMWLPEFHLRLPSKNGNFRPESKTPPPNFFICREISSKLKQFLIFPNQGQNVCCLTRTMGCGLGLSKWDGWGYLIRGGSGQPVLFHFVEQENTRLLFWLLMTLYWKERFIKCTCIHEQREYFAAGIKETKAIPQVLFTHCAC